MKLPEPAAGYGHGCNIELQDGQHLYTAHQMRKYRADGIAEAEAARLGSCPDISACMPPERKALTQDQLNELHIRLGGVPKQPTYNEKKVKA